jgi:hypothetical protein
MAAERRYPELVVRVASPIGEGIRGTAHHLGSNRFKLMILT